MVLGTRSGTLQRRLKIADWIRRQGEMRVEELSAALGVSEVTIRSDLTYLAEQGLVLRSFGKAMAAEVSPPRSSEPVRKLSRAAAAPMMQLARQLIEPEQTLLICSGDLPPQVLPLLVETAGLTILLSSIDAALLAQRCLDCDIHLLGGRIGADGVSLEGPLATQGLQTQLFQTVVVEATAVGNEGNLVMPTRAAEQFCDQALRRARRRIVLVASADLSLDAKLYQVPLEEVDHLIFPSVPDAGCQRALASAGFKPSSQAGSAVAHFKNNRSSGG